MKTNKNEKYRISIRRNIKYFYPIAFKKYPSYFVLNLFKIIINSFSPLINIYFPALIVDELLNNKDLDKIILYVSVIVIGNLTVRLIIRFLESRIKLINDKMKDFFNTVINHKTMRIDYEDCENPEIKDLVEKARRGMTNDTNGIAEGMEKLSSIISNTISFSTVVLIVINARMPLLILLSAVNVIIGIILVKTINAAQIKFWEENARLNRRFSYFYYQIMAFNFAKDLRLYDANALVKNSCLKQSEQTCGLYKKLTLKSGKIHEIGIICTYIIEKALVYLVLIIGCFKGDITITTLTLLLNAFITFNSSLSSVINNTLYFKQTANYQSKYIDYIEYESKRKTGTIIPEPKVKSIEFRHVSFKYPRTEDYVLEDINLKITNERISLVGLNGAGKTTLIKLLCRFYEDYEGTILVNDIDIKEYNYEEYLKLFSVVFQDFKVISFTVKENVSNIEENSEKLYEVFRKAGIEKRILELPKKENTFVNKWFDKEGVEFSGGEMQKIAISRALYKDGPIVILDEPTAALDPLAEAEIYYRFNEVIGKKLTIFISHRLSSCRFADRIIVLDGKKVVEIGNHEQLMSNEKGRYKEMFDAQAKYYQENSNIEK